MVTPRKQASFGFRTKGLTMAGAMVAKREAAERAATIAEKTVSNTGVKERLAAAFLDNVHKGPVKTIVSLFKALKG